MNPELTQILPHGQWSGDVASAHLFDASLTEEMIRLLRQTGVSTVLDLGCGTGAYVHALRAAGFQARGVDGHPDTAVLAGEDCTTADLSERHDFGRHDVVICLEVGEHVPGEFEAVLLDNISAHAAEWALLSWAVPGQPGFGHVNCRTNADIVAEMERRGFVRLPEREVRARAFAFYGWFRETFMVFRRLNSLPLPCGGAMRAGDSAGAIARISTGELADHALADHRWYMTWGTGGSEVLFSESGRFFLPVAGRGGSWEELDMELDVPPAGEAKAGDPNSGTSAVLKLEPETGGSLFLEKRDWGYDGGVLRLTRIEAQFVGFWHDFDPRLPLYRTLADCPWRITSPYGNVDRIVNGQTWDAVISGENAAVTVEEDGRMRWEFGGRRGYTRCFIGTPKVDSPMALHVPHFYDYWGRLGDWRPERRKAEAGISFLASNLGQPGSLAARRLEIAQALSRWFTVAIPPRLAALFPAGAKLRPIEVPRTPRAKYEFVSGFTFNLCFENSRGPGYLSEKPFDALISGAVPIYEGDPGAGEWIEPSAMIECIGLGPEEIADRIREAERNGTVERVHSAREALILVSLEEMVRRVEAFAETAGGRAAAG